MQTFPSLAAFLLVAGIAAPASAQRSDDRQPRPTPPTIMAAPVALAIASFDRDSDLEVSRKEYDEGVRRSFARGDRDGDGTITLIELSAWSQAELGNANALPGQFDFDRDGDDRISLAEFMAEFGRRFTALDKNQDGLISRAELVNLIAMPMGDGSRRGKTRRQVIEGGGPPPGAPLKQ